MFLYEDCSSRNGICGVVDGDPFGADPGVVAVDVIGEKVEKINRRVSPIQDEYIERFVICNILFPVFSQSYFPTGQIRRL